MNLLGLLGCGGLAGSDGPYGFVCHDNLLHILCGEVVEHVLHLGGAYVEVLAGLPLVEVLTDAENHAESASKGQLHLLDELPVGLSVILAALGMSEYGPLAAHSLEHVD